ALGGMAGRVAAADRRLDLPDPGVVRIGAVQEGEGRKVEKVGSAGASLYRLSTFNSLSPCLAHLALAFEGGALLHLQAGGVDGTGEQRGRGEAAGGEVAVAGHLALDDGLLRLQVA